MKLWMRHRLSACILICCRLFIFAIAEDATKKGTDSYERPSNGTTHQKRQAAFGATCMPLSTINGQVNYLQTNPSIPYSPGTTAILTCNMGFSITGSSNSICMNSIWSPPLGSCMLSGINMNGMNLGVFGSGAGQPMATGGPMGGGGGGAQCFGLMPPINGQLQYSQSGMFGSYPTGTTVSLKCNPGLVQTGPPISTCEMGTWQPPSAGFCANPGGGNGFSMNGVTISSGSSIGLPGVTSMVSSMPSSMVNGNMPQCASLSRPNNGQINYSMSQMGAGYSIGTIATLLCNPGLVPSQITAICGASGMWSPQIGQCSPLSDAIGGRGTSGLPGLMGRNCILGLLPPLGAIINYSSGEALGPYPSGTVAILNCHSGTTIGPTSSTCEAGQWNPPFFHGCSMWHSSASTHAFQDMPSESSSPNPFLSSPPGTLAQPQGIGSMPGMMTMPPIDVCALGVPPVISGTVTYSQGGDFGPYPSGTVANLQCQGSQPLGLMSSSCLGGRWQPPSIGPCGNNPGGQDSENTATGPPPPSVRPDLPVPPTSSPDFASAPTGLLPPAGSPNPAVTVGIPNPLGGGLPIGGIGLNNGIIGLPQQCLLPPLPPLNGQIAYSRPNTPNSVPSPVPPSFGPYQPGTTATLTCNPGFSPNGPSTSTCRAGMFEPILGNCMPSMLGMPAVNVGGAVSPQANDEPMLKNDHTEETQTPTTQRIGSTSNGDTVDETSEEDDFPSCPDLMYGSPEFGHVIYAVTGARDSAAKSDRTVALPTTPTMIQHSVGSVATLECEEGFISIGDTTARCETSGWLPPALGKCVHVMTTQSTSVTDVRQIKNDEITLREQKMQHVTKPSYSDSLADRN